MKKKFWFIIALLTVVIAACFAACKTETEVSVSSVTITNKDALSAVWVIGEGDRTVQYSVSPDDVENVSVTVESGNEQVVKVQGNKLKAVGAGQSVITVKAQDKSDTVTVNVSVGMPVLQAKNEEGVINCYANSYFSLTDELIARTCDGREPKLTVAFDDAYADIIEFDETSNTLLVSEKGSFEITVKAADGRDESKYVEKSFAINSYRKVFDAVEGWAFGIDIDVDYAEDEEQTAVVRNNGIVFASYAAKPSKVYYAEATFDCAEDLDAFIGISHTDPNDSTRWLAAQMDTGSWENNRNYYLRYYDMVDLNWDDGFWAGDQSDWYYSMRLGKFRGLNLNKDVAFPCKVATARIDDYFYFFVEDQYVNACTAKNFTDIDTVPGIYGQGIADKVTIKNMNWLEGDAAMNKFNALTENGKKLITAFGLGDWTLGSLEEGNFTLHEAGNDGLGYTFNKSDCDWNDGQVSPYIYFDGNFAFEFTYTPTVLTDDSCMQFLLNNNQYRDSHVEVGFRKNDIYIQTLRPMSADYDGNGQIAQITNWFDATEGADNSAEVKVSRICNFDGTADWTVSVTLVRDKSKTITIEYRDNGYETDWNGGSKYGWNPCSAIVPNWKNRMASGVFTKIKWHNLEASIPEVKNISITNKSELTAGFVVGDADRTLNLAFNPSQYYNQYINKVTVTPSKSGVVEIDGLTVKAVGAGTVTLTVAIGEVKDTVTITVRSSERNITISNKTDLEKLWLLNSGTRQVELLLSPEDFTEAEAGITITSSDNSVVSVNGKTLTAHKAGNVTITVTCSASPLLTDSVDISVFALESMIVTNKTSLEADFVLGEAPREVEIACEPQDKIEESGISPIITSSDENVVKAVDGTLVAVGKGSATVTVELADQSVTIQVNVIITPPTVELKDGAEAIGCIEGETVNLSEVLTVETCDGTPLTYTVTVSEKVSYDSAEKTLTAAEKGEYEITVKAVDERDSEKATTKTFTFNVYRKVFGLQTGENGGAITLKDSGYKPDAEQVAEQTKGYGSILAQLNAQPGKVYYAEVTFNNTSRVDVVGMTHSVKGNADKWLSSVLWGKDGWMDMPNDYDMFIATFNGLDDCGKVLWDLDNHTNNVKKLAVCRQNSFENTTSITLATARINENFYYFVNGKFVSGIRYAEFANVDTVPGIYGNDINSNDTKTCSLTNISWLTGNEAQEKFNSLTGGNIMGMYCPDSWAVAGMDWDALSNKTATQNGMNFDIANATHGWNDGSVSPYMFFEGSFEMEWTFNPTVFNAGSRLQFIIAAGGVEKDINIEGKGFWSAGGEEADLNGWYDAAADNSVKVTFKRVCGADGNSTYYLTATLLRDATKTYSHQVSVDGQEAIQIYWKTPGIAGKFTGFKWGTLSTSLTINNTDELSSMWAVGDENREVDYSLAVGMDASQVKITSDNSQVISVESDGSLKAAGAGTATITVTCGGVSDTVTITVLPTFIGVEITDKDSLTATWKVGEADREIAYSFNPSEYSDDNVTVVIESSDEAVIKVVGKKLQAIGGGTATVTITANGKTDSVEITVIELTEIAITNKTELESLKDNDEAKTITLSFTPSEHYNLTNTEVTVTLSKEGVVSVDGLKITPVAVGEVVITVACGEVKDTVTVQVRSSVKSIIVSNKDELEKDWRLGVDEATRTVSLLLSPEDFTEAEAGITITSSNDEVVSVSGKTLTAHKAGNATVTVTSSAITDLSIEISINVYELTSVTITNKTELEADFVMGSDARTIEITLNDENGKYTQDNTEITITSDDESVITVTDGNQLNAVGVGETTVTVTAAGKTAQVGMKVIVTEPTISIDVTSVDCCEEDEIQFPEFTVTACDGTDNLNVSVEVVESSGLTYNEETKTVTATAKGAYTIRITATDSRDENVYATQDVTFNVYRKVFGLQTGENGGVITLKDNGYKSDAEQVAEVGGGGGAMLAQLNAQPGKVYYAEVTFNNTKRVNHVGMTHSVKGNADKWLSSVLWGSDGWTEMPNDYDMFIATFNGLGDCGRILWDLNNHTNNVKKLAAYRQNSFANTTTITVATARINENFYYFVNGKYVSGIRSEEFRNVDTVPGIYGNDLNNDANKTCSLTNISWLTGDEARAKFNSLTADGNVMEMFCTNDWAQSQMDWNALSNKTSTENGMSFDIESTHTWDSGIIGPYMFFEGSFEMEWTFNPTIFDAGSRLQFIIDANGATKADMNIEASGFWSDGGAPASLNDWYDETADNSVKVTFKRVCGADGNSTYYFTATLLRDESKTYSYEVAVDGQETLQVYWKTPNIAGNFTDFKWSAVEA